MRGGPHKPAILAVDDQPANLKLLERMLRASGYENIVLVDDPRAVVETYKSVRPDLILLDVNMPHFDGFQLIEMLKALGDPLLPPILALTAQNDRETMVRVLSCGARDFVGKPFDQNELLARVRNLLELQATARLLHGQNAALEGMVRERTAELEKTARDLAMRESNLSQGARLGKFGAWVWDVALGRYLYCSDDLARLFDLRLEDFLSPLLHRPHIPATLTRGGNGEHPGTDGVTYDVEFETPGPDGGLRHFREIGKIRADREGGAVSVVGITQDITETKNREAALRRLMEEARELTRLAQQADKSKSEFLAAMSHELRTPLNAIIGFTEMMMLRPGGHPAGKAVEYHADILKSARHLLSLINDILDLAKLESGRLVPNAENAVLQELVAECVSYVALTARENGVSIRVEVPPIAVETDGRMLKQVLINLLSNAVKFNRPGGTVTVSADEYADGVDISVNDSGIGMSRAEISLATQPFTQIDASFNRRYEGSGLGLTLVCRFVHRLGGSVSIDSTKGVGTKIGVRLPRLRGSSGAREISDAGSSGAPVRPAPQPADAALIAHHPE